MWGRLSPHPAFDDRRRGHDGGRRRSGRRVRPTRVAPIALFLREDAPWLLAIGAAAPTPRVGRRRSRIRRARCSTRCGGTARRFFADLVQATGRLTSEVEDALWELAAAGLVTADGFENLRALVDPEAPPRRRARRASRGRGMRAGRWALLRAEIAPDRSGSRPMRDVEAFARQLLLRWGVVFRDLLARETLAPPWRDLLVALRRMEARGEIRGGRFVAGFVGEQFARPEARGRAARRPAQEPSADAVARRGGRSAEPRRHHHAGPARQPAVGSDRRGAWRRPRAGRSPGRAASAAQRPRSVLMSDSTAGRSGAFGASFRKRSKYAAVRSTRLMRE